MKIALFSDIHGNYHALKEIMNDINKKDFDKIIFLGDCIGLGVDSNKCLKILNNKKVTFLLGNHEIYYTRGNDVIKTKTEEINEHNIWIDKSIKYKIIENNNLKYEINYKGKKLVFSHYFLNNKRYPFEGTNLFRKGRYKDVMKKTNCDYMFYGHLHKERVDKVDNKTFYCLGSSGCTKDDKTMYYILDLSDDIKLEKVVLKYDRKKFENRINSIDFPNKKDILKEFYGMK